MSVSESVRVGVALSDATHLELGNADRGKANNAQTLTNDLPNLKVVVVFLVVYELVDHSDSLLQAYAVPQAITC